MAIFTTLAIVRAPTQSDAKRAPTMHSRTTNNPRRQVIKGNTRSFRHAATAVRRATELVLISEQMRRSILLVGGFADPNR